MDQPSPKPKRARKQPAEFKIVALRECAVPERLHLCDTPEKAHEYFELHIKSDEKFRPECECFITLFLNTRRRIIGHYIVSVGTLDSLLIHPREVFRAAIISASSAVVLMHNHPSGDPSPSEADIRVTRDLIRAGQILKIDVLDHVIVGHDRKVSLKELGYFYT